MIRRDFVKQGRYLNWKVPAVTNVATYGRLTDVPSGEGGKRYDSKGRVNYGEFTWENILQVAFRKHNRLIILLWSLRPIQAPVLN